MCVSKPEVKRKRRRDTTEIDLVGQEAFVEQILADCSLVAHLSTDRPDVRNRESNAAEHDGADGGSVLDVAIPEQRAVAEVDELADLGISPVEHADAGADVRL